MVENKQGITRRVLQNHNSFSEPKLYSKLYSTAKIKYESPWVINAFEQLHGSKTIKKRRGRALVSTASPLLVLSCPRTLVRRNPEATGQSCNSCSHPPCCRSGRGCGGQTEKRQQSQNCGKLFVWLKSLTTDGSYLSDELATSPARRHAFAVVPAVEHRFSCGFVTYKRS